MTLNAGQYLALCEACDRVLLAPDATIERVAVPWLHVIREHPVFLQNYADEVRGSGGAAARSKRALRRQAIQWRQLWRAARSDGLPWHTAGALPESVEVLFVSHLLNAAQAGQAEDFYFGTLAEELCERGRPAALALLNHSGRPSRDLAARWPSSAAPRAVLSASLGLHGERALRRRLLNESHRIGRLARGAASSFERSVWSRAAAETLSEGALATLRMAEQVGALVAKLRPSAIVVTHEGHAWERVVFAAARRSRPGIRCIGYQHAALFKLQHAVRRNLLAPYNPDRIVASGKVSAAQLASAPRLAGVPVSVLGSSRARKTGAFDSRTTPATRRAGKAGTCLVLPEGIPAECHLLFELSLECARACPETRFVWRLHPIVSFESLLERNAKLRNRPPNVELSTRTFADDLAGAGWALYRGSTAVIEAVAERVRPIYLQIPGEMTVDPLYELEGFRERVTTAADFVRVVQSAREGMERDDAAADAARAYCSAMYVPFNVDVLLEVISPAASSEVAGSALRLHGDGVVKKLLRRVAKRIPGVRYVFNKHVALTLKSRPAEDVFTSYFAGNTWGGKESVSGQGSDAEQTRIVVRELGVLLRELGIRTLLDVPCGDFHWMKDVDLGTTSYIGADIVADLIKRNEMRYGNERVRFEKRNLLGESLPKLDMIFCRDCLVHFSYADVFRALRNICDSGSTYLLTTTFPGRRKNDDIVTGQWRPLNLQVAPIGLPTPVRVMDEGCTESNGAFRDKALGLWRVDDLRAHLLSNQG